MQICLNRDARLIGRIEAAGERREGLVIETQDPKQYIRKNWQRGVRG